MINNLTVDIVEHSYMRDRIASERRGLPQSENGEGESLPERIYLADEQGDVYKEQIEPMFAELYETILADLATGDENAPVYKHFIEESKANAASTTKARRTATKNRIASRWTTWPA